MTTCHHCQTEFHAEAVRRLGSAPDLPCCWSRGTPPEWGTDWERRHRCRFSAPTQVAQKPTLATKAPLVTLREPILRPHKLPSGASWLRF